MSTTFVVVVEGLEGFQRSVDEMSPAIKRAALRAVAKTTDRARTRASKEVREQVAFPASYLAPSGKRLFVAKKPTLRDLTGTIRSRDQATMLARFTKEKPLITSEQRKRKRRKVKNGCVDGVKVTVTPQITKAIPSSFLLELKSGNIGLAVRTDGPAPSRSWKPRQLGKNLWLLYGPSVDQVLMSRRESRVFPDISPDTLAHLEREFLRLVELEKK